MFRKPRYGWWPRLFWTGVITLELQVIPIIVGPVQIF